MVEINKSVINGVLYEDDCETSDGGLKKPSIREANPRTYRYKWLNITLMSLVHLQAIYGIYLVVFGHVKLLTLIFCVALIITSGWGITAGAHRLWSHRSFKSKWPLTLMLMIFNTIAFQNNVIHWARDHRIHHKYTDTDSDPYNAARGLFFSHIGWVLVRKHDKVVAAGKQVDVSDLEADPILRFQRDHYQNMMLLFCFILPTATPYFLWNETLLNSWIIAVCLRYVYTCNGSWLVNSFAHKFGNRPYDESILPTQNYLVSLISLGEGWHNYHHVFPWDYASNEIPLRMNLTTRFIDAMAKIGWAYDLKVVKKDTMKSRQIRTGAKKLV